MVTTVMVFLLRRLSQVVDGKGDLEGCSRRAFSMRDVYDSVYEYILDVISDTVRTSGLRFEIVSLERFNCKDLDS